MPKPKTTKSKTVADFRAAHDRNVIVPNKITAGLAALEKAHGAEAWEYEGEFIKRAGISQTDVGLFRDGFKKHIVETTGKPSKRVWFAAAKVAAKVRGE